MAAGRRAGQRGQVGGFCSKTFKNVFKFLNLKVQRFGQGRAKAAAVSTLSGGRKAGSTQHDGLRITIKKRYT